MTGSRIGPSAVTIWNTKLELQFDSQKSVTCQRPEHVSLRLVDSHILDRVAPVNVRDIKGAEQLLVSSYSSPSPQALAPWKAQPLSMLCVLILGTILSLPE